MEINNALLVALGYLYIAGAFISWWIIDQTQSSRPLIAATWAISVPFLILTEALQPTDGSDDDDDSDFGV